MIDTPYLREWRELSEEQKYAKWSECFEQTEAYGDYVFFCNYVDKIAGVPNDFFSAKSKGLRSIFLRRS